MMYEFENEKLQDMLQSCIKEYEEYRVFIGQTVDFSNPHALIDRLEGLNGHNASIPRLRSRFEYLLEQATAVAMNKIDHEAMPAKKFDALVKQQVASIAIFAKATEMLLKESHYQIESIRSVLAYLRAEVNNING